MWGRSLGVSQDQQGQLVRASNAPTEELILCPESRGCHLGASVRRGCAVRLRADRGNAREGAKRRFVSNSVAASGGLGATSLG